MKGNHRIAAGPRAAKFERARGLDVLADRFDDARASGGKTLSLWRCYLDEVPEEVWSFPGLESIDLSENRLGTIPAKLRELPHLRRIYLTGNPIEHLPDVPGLVMVPLRKMHESENGSAR